MPDKKNEFAFKSLTGLLGHVFKLDYFVPNDDGKVPIPHFWHPGRGNFAVALGENASGKSFFRRLVSAVCREAGVEIMPISMEGRFGNYGGLRGMIYGDESWESTGENSAGTVLAGISTCKSRENAHVIFWDEPDLGLSDRWAAGMGVALRGFAEALPKKTHGAIIVTHSRALVQELLPAEPHYLHFGSSDPPATLQAWLSREIKPKSLDLLKEESRKRFKLIQTILNRVEKRKEARR